jgi:DNA-binding LacI/PurR family transcriptional regulator/biotin operon repressor
MTGRLSTTTANGLATDTPGKVAFVREHLLSAIQRKEYAQGHRIPTENRLATQLGISRNTVREAVASLVQEGVLSRRQGSGTYVLRTLTIAQRKDRLAEMKVVRVGLVLPVQGAFAPMNSYLRRLIEGLTHAEQDAPAVEVRFLSPDAAYRGPSGVHFLDAIQQRTIDILLMTVFEVNSADLDEAIASGIPVIFAGLASPRPGIAFVRSNLAAGVTKLANHLYDIGCKRIGLLMNTRGGVNSAAYLSGMVAAMARRGLDLDLSCIAYLERDRERIEDALKSLLDQGADAIVCYDDDVAVNVLCLLKQWKVDVPGKVAVAGANNTAASDGTEFIPLTTLNVHIEEMGRAVRDMAFDAISRGSMLPRTLDFELELIVRDSAPIPTTT